MATISSHILDTVEGQSAVGIRAELFRLDAHGNTTLFNVIASDEGRVMEELDLTGDAADCEYELVFYSGLYFQGKGSDASSHMQQVVLRFSMPDKQKRYHMPIMLSPYNYSVWWSK